MLSQQSVSSALLLRVNDTSIHVLQTLYTTSPETVTQAFLSLSPTAYLDALKQALHDTSSKMSRDVIRAHLTFLLSHFLPGAAASSAPEDDHEGDESEENRERARRVFMEILMPFLLYSKPRMKTAQAVWEILESTEGGGVSFELLGGCVDAMKWEQARPVAGAKDKDGDNNEGIDVALSPKVNLAVAAKIAGRPSLSFLRRPLLTRLSDNILASNFFKENFHGLLERLCDENPHGRALAYLVTRALLNRLSGEQRVEAGHRVLEAMQLATLEGMGDFMRGVEDVGSVSTKSGSSRQRFC